VATRIGIGAAVFLIVAGALLMWRVAPEPHGIVTGLLAAPVCALGVAVFGVVGLINWRRINWSLRVASGALLLTGAGYVFTIILWFVRHAA